MTDDREHWSLEAPGIHSEQVPMRDRSDEVVDVVIVGAGSGGGTLGAKLAEAGFSVVILDAGAHWDPLKDFVSDEKGSSKLYWNDVRITGGGDPVKLGKNNSGKGVGGSTVHYSMVAMRMHPNDFRRRSLHGELDGAHLTDWPISFDDLEPYYDQVEEDLQIAGPTHYPWGRRKRRYPQREHELNAAARMMVRGCTELGIEVAPAPIATLSAPHGTRPPCVYRGFCNFGCSTNAKSSVLVTYIPRAIAAGAEVRANAMVAKVEHDERGLATGVLYFRGDDHKTLHRQRARNVVVAGYAVESPRLLLNSESSMFPDGLANGNGQVGKCFMVHTGRQVYARFAERMNQHIAPPPGGAISEHFNRTMEDTDFVCGYTIEVVGPHPSGFASTMSSARKMWGSELREAMADFNHWAGVGIVGEVLAQPDNEVRLHPDVTDQYGLPVPHVLFTLHDNDKRISRHADERMRAILEAAGGQDAWASTRTAHLLGTCRMGDDPTTSVVDSDCRSHEVPNLFVCDGSVFSTSSAVNPSLTIQAIASRTADRMAALARTGEIATG